MVQRASWLREKLCKGKGSRWVRVQDEPSFHQKERKENESTPVHVFLGPSVHKPMDPFSLITFWVVTFRERQPWAASWPCSAPLSVPVTSRAFSLLWGISAWRKGPPSLLLFVKLCSLCTDLFSVLRMRRCSLRLFKNIQFLSTFSF